MDPGLRREDGTVGVLVTSIAISLQPRGRTAMTPRLLLAGALIALIILPAIAQNAPEGTPTRVRGTVEKLDGQNLTVKSREGTDLTIVLAPNFAVGYLVKKSLADIKSGDFVATTSIK